MNTIRNILEEVFSNGRDELTSEPRIDEALQAIEALVNEEVIGKDQRPATESSELMKQLSPNNRRIDWQNELRQEARENLRRITR